MLRYIRKYGIILILVSFVFVVLFGLSKSKGYEEEINRLKEEKESILQEKDKEKREIERSLTEKQHELNETSNMLENLQTKLKEKEEETKEKLEKMEEEKKNIEKQLFDLDKKNKDLEKQLGLKREKLVASNSTTVSRGGRPIKATYTVTATAYTADCKGCSGITTTGVDVRSVTPKIIAVDPTVIPLKSKVEIIVGGVSWGVYSAEDTGGAIKGNKIDILMTTKEEANVFGRRQVVVNVL